MIKVVGTEAEQRGDRVSDIVTIRVGNRTDQWIQVAHLLGWEADAGAENTVRVIIPRANGRAVDTQRVLRLLEDQFTTATGVLPKTWPKGR